MTTQLFTDLGWLSRPPPEFESRCRAAMKMADGDARELKALAQYALDDDRLLSLSRTLARFRARGQSLAPLQPYKIGLIANYTSNFVAAAVVGTALRYGLALECVTGAYDQGLQESLDPQSTINRAQPNAMLIAIDWRGLPLPAGRTAGSTPQDAIDASLH